MTILLFAVIAYVVAALLVFLRLLYLYAGQPTTLSRRRRVGLAALDSLRWGPFLVWYGLQNFLRELK